MTPQHGPPSRRVVCPVCDAVRGHPCVVWKYHRGQRLYIVRHTTHSHPARANAARTAGHQLPAGRGGRADG